MLELLDAEFRFTLDPCPLDNSGLAGASLWGKDGTLLSWKGERVFCNPPYSNIEPWIARGREAELAVFLLPVRSDVPWWHDHALKADELRFIQGRLRFDAMSGGAPFPNVLVIYRGGSGLNPPLCTSLALTAEQRKGFVPRS